MVKKAVILAAGRGRRMGKLTKDRPKAALVVGDHALIDWQIAALQAAGVEEIAVVTGHGAQALAARGVSYIHNPDWDKGTQVETLLRAADWIGDEPAVVSYGDILYHPCAALALLERPGDIVVGYDADHRWLWKERFGNWLKDSETFKLGPGQVLTEIGGKPTDIEELDGQFMGLMLLTPEGLTKLAERYRAAPAPERQRLDFTRLLSTLIAEGARIDTAANLLPWMEVDRAKDLAVARKMVERDDLPSVAPRLVYAGQAAAACVQSSTDESELVDESEITSRADDPALRDDHSPSPEAYAQVGEHRIVDVFAVQNWGRSGSTFLQSLLDDHPQVLSTPNFYSRRYYLAWARSIARVPDGQKIDAFLKIFRQWWDPGLVDATAGLHRLGPHRNALAGVSRQTLEGYLRAAFATGRSITRRSLFEAGHLAYALARGQSLAPGDLQIMFPVHGEPRSVAAALLEDFPHARFIHTIREPTANVASSIEHLCFNGLDVRADALESVLASLFDRRSRRYGPPHTSFESEAYFPYLAANGQARLLRLEDLHGDGAGVLASLCAWLNLQQASQLLISTYDGKLWWNRPESGSDSRIGGQALDRNAPRLGPVDRSKVRALLDAAPNIAAAYPAARQETTRPVEEKLAVAIGRWRQEHQARRSEVRCLTSLLTIAPILPKAFVNQLKQALERERYRARLLELNAGAIGVRRRLSDADKSGTVRAVLLISASSTGWRTRALSDTRPDQRVEADRLGAGFLDELVVPRSVRQSLFWAAALGLGWPLARLHTYLSIRGLMIRRIMRPSAATTPLTLCAAPIRPP
ncbi:NTP transferase domain-containing protein [Caulobacter sp. RL271]|uniref:NTP transferase domain-containing protein n=1 Tax=Caulobacter segnis TaxID=88688 RepID=A0ABY4ZRS5_9CAUL|nr:NTP transferase domain-containing protein [Caulobacter segnis]USQ95291.1 NTP transferase domain-containing protein [Caulobacter segnis]